MKKTVKRILTAFVCMAMLISCFGVFVYADTPLKGSYVEFVKDDSANTISAKAYVRNPEGNAETAAWLLLAEYNGDVMEKAATNKLTLAAGKEDFITTAAIEYNSARKYNAFLWYGDESCRPIAPTATYGYNGQLLTGISIDGVEMEGFDASKTEYTLPPAADGVVPVTKGITADNSVYTTTSYEKSGNNYIAKVSAKSSDGTKTETYTITYTNSIYDTTNGYNAFHAISAYNNIDATKPENWVQDIEETSNKQTYNGWVLKDSVLNKTNIYTPVLCSNLHGNPDFTDPTKTGSRWVTDYAPGNGTDWNIQGQQVLSIPSGLEGLDYFIFNSNGRNDRTIDLSFTLSRAAEVAVYTTEINAFTGFATQTKLAENNWIVAGYKNKDCTDKTTGEYSTDANSIIGYAYPWKDSDGNWTKGYNQKYDGTIPTKKEDLVNSYNGRYQYLTTKSYSAGETVTVTTGDSKLIGRTPIVVIKPIASEVKPMFEYNMTYGGMTLDQFCAAIGATKNTEYTGLASNKIKVNEVRKVTENEFTYNGITGGTLIGLNNQRYLNKVEKTSGFENAYLTATDKEITYETKYWFYNVFYNKSTTDNIYPLVSRLNGNVLWQTFKVKRDCEVFVFSCASASNPPAFASDSANGWTALDFDTTKNTTPFTAIRGTAYGWDGSPTNVKYQCVYVKEFKAGETANLYNSGVAGASGEDMPYMTVVRFK